MIELTRLNGSPLAVNAELIEYAESAPDTLLTMVTGEKLIVSEGVAEVAERMVAYRARTLALAARRYPGAVVSASGAAPEALNAMNAADAVDEESAARMWRRKGKS